MNTYSPILFFLFLTLIGCNSGEKTELDQDNQRVAEELKHLKDDNSVKQSTNSVQKVFDGQKMLSLLNEFVPGITELKESFKYSVDTLDKTDNHFKGIYSDFGNALLLNHEFNCGEYFKNIIVTKAEYNSAINAKSTYKKISTSRYESRPGCFTKTNSYLVAIDSDIFWLQVSCNYSKDNFQKIIEILRESLTNNNEDAFGCVCGGSELKI